MEDFTACCESAGACSRAGSDNESDGYGEGNAAQEAAEAVFSGWIKAEDTGIDDAVGITDEANAEVSESDAFVGAAGAVVANCVSGAARGGSGPAAEDAGADDVGIADEVPTHPPANWRRMRGGALPWCRANRAIAASVRSSMRSLLRC